MCSIFSIVKRTFGFSRIGLKTEIFGSSSHQGYTLTPQNFRHSVITAAEHHFVQKMFLEGASYIQTSCTRSASAGRFSSAH